MQIFIFEWVVGGGFLDQPNPAPASLLSEGAVMLEAVAKDFSSLSGTHVRTILADKIGPLPFVTGLPPFDTVDTAEARERQFDKRVAEADATILIAPEFDGILLRLSQRVVDLGGHLLSPGPEFIEATSDKHSTATRLHAAGIRVPEGIVLMPGESTPASFSYPAVLKPIDGAGSLSTLTLQEPYRIPDGPGAFRLECFIPGTPASVALICGPEGALALEPCLQQLSTDGKLAYQGGELPLPESLRSRAQDLALRALQALPPAIGYIGMDMVLGEAEEGSGDTLLEVNPRYSTSYIGLRAATTRNLAESVLHHSAGKYVMPHEFHRNVKFEVTGEVSFW